MVYLLVIMTIVAHLIMQEIDVHKTGTAITLLQRPSNTIAHAVGLGIAHVVVAQEWNLVANLQ